MAAALFPPALRRTVSMQRHADYLAQALDDLSERCAILRSEALRLRDDKAAAEARLAALTSSSELARCEGAFDAGPRGGGLRGR
jgi:hypothetical protein